MQALFNVSKCQLLFRGDIKAYEKVHEDVNVLKNVNLQ